MGKEELQLGLVVNVALYPPDMKRVAARLIQVAKLLDENPAEEVEADEEPEAPKKSKKKKPAKEEDEEFEAEESDEEVSEDGGEGDSEEETDSSDDDSDSDPREEVTNALRSYAKKHGKTDAKAGRKKAIAVMKKVTGCDSADDLEPKHFKKLLAALK